ncbi:MAG: AmmeMemoRadiSam system protein B [Patescibacteria group bacterium]
MGAIIALVGLGCGVYSGLATNVVNNEPVHETYFKHQTDLFDAAYALDNNQSTNSEIRGLLVNHHLLAANLIAQAFNKVDGDQINTVILLSPNHFDAGVGNFLTTIGTWQTPYGELRADTKLIIHLAKKGLVKIDPAPFDAEHGVGNIVPFVRKSLPKAKIVPIIFNNRVTLVDVLDWGEQIAGLLPKGVLIVASIDMSHMMPESIANQQDKITIGAITQMDPELASQRPIDAPKVLAVLLQLMQKLGADNWQLLARSSSAILSDSKNPIDNTSYITGFFY